MNKNDFAKYPPMGWNSWDCYGAAVTEKRAAAECRLYGGAFEGAWLGVCRL